MPQTVYTEAILARAVAGMIADQNERAEITSYPASELIPAGRACELQADGTLKLPQSTTLGNVKGVSIYQASRPPIAYQIGEMVPLMRRGRIWAEFTGSGATDGETLRIEHSTTTATDRGKFTDKAISAVAGTEVDAFAKGECRGGQATPALLALVDLNLP